MINGSSIRTVKIEAAYQLLVRKSLEEKFKPEVISDVIKEHLTSNSFFYPCLAAQALTLTVSKLENGEFNSLPMASSYNVSKVYALSRDSSKKLENNENA